LVATGAGAHLLYHIVVVFLHALDPIDLGAGAVAELALVVD
jgi:hypothetical protein